jgi:16S rRNA (uracil1498-N3)-methyltransferase
MHRFFLPPENIGEKEVVFPDTAIRQIRSVLRLKPGEQVTVLDNRGSQFLVQLDVVSPEMVHGILLSRSTAEGEPSIRLRLFFSVTQREKVEWILQKCTEIGVTAFFPFVSTYSLSREKGMDVSRLRRWEKIIQEAAEQCGRGRIPALHEVSTLQDAIKKASPRREINLLAWEGERELYLHQLMRGMLPGMDAGKKVNVFIGPEGGFAEGEVDMMKKAGFTSFSLGKRIYRVETAAMAACLLILYELENPWLEKPVGQQVL